MSELGIELGVSYQQVQRYEKGRDGIYASTIYKIARTLGVPVSYFFDRPANNDSSSDKPPNDAAVDFLLDRTGLALLRAFKRVSDRKLRRQITELVETVSRIDSRPKKRV